MKVLLLGWKSAVRGRRGFVEMSDEWLDLVMSWGCRQWRGAGCKVMDKDGRYWY